MKKMSRVIVVSSLCLFSLGLPFVNLVHAEEENVTISKEQSGAIVQSCDSIKQSLKTLQKDDARTRAFLGSSYEDLLSDFISPMNLRLVKNDKPSTTLTDVHSNILTKRQDFSQSFVLYSQDLEKLVSIDCKTQPDEFYIQLVKTRTSRATVEKATKAMRELLTKHQAGVKELKGKL